MIEIHGYPHTITDVERLEDGQRTQLSFVPPAVINLAFVEDDESVRSDVNLTFRPVYPPGVVPYIGVGPFFTDENFELILWQEGQPGQALVPQEEYQYDPNTGEIVFNPNVMDYVRPGERLTFARKSMKRVLSLIHI